MNRKWENSEIDFIKTHYKIMGPTKVGKQLGRSYFAISNKAKLLGLRKEVDKDFCNEDLLIEAIKKSECFSDALRFLGKSVTGGNMKVLKRKVFKLNIDTNHLNTWKKNIDRKEISIQKYLIFGSKIGSSALKKKLFKSGLKKEICENCGQLPIWNNKKLTLQLDHINGNNIDNRQENLMILCPNCHSQTKTFSIGNNRLKKMKYLNQSLSSEAERLLDMQ